MIEKSLNDKEVIEKLKALRDVSMQKALVKADKANYIDLVRGIDTGIKNIKLMAGEASEITRVDILDLSKNYAGSNSDNNRDEEVASDDEEDPSNPGRDIGEQDI